MKNLVNKIKQFLKSCLCVIVKITKSIYKYIIKKHKQLKEFFLEC